MMAWFNCTPAMPPSLVSTIPTNLAMCPAPSASKMPPMPTGLVPLKPCSARAYWPLRSDSLPVPQAAELMVMLSAWVAVCAVGVVESVALTVKLLVPAVVGVPVMAPVLALSDRPTGSVPVMLQVTGAVPPLDWSVAL